MAKTKESIEAAHRREMSKIVSKNGADFGQLGDAAAMYKALVAVKKLFDGRLMFQSAIRTAHEAVNAALAKPPRNCDVGTARQQEKRHKEEVCPKSACPKHEGYVSKACKGCFAMWAQMPYEKGGVK